MDFIILIIFDIIIYYVVFLEYSSLGIEYLVLVVIVSFVFV